jgi:DEAD/DEAH box helicase domain-containing protein
MIPSVLANHVRRGVEDFLRTTFPISSPFFHGLLDRLIEQDGSVFQGPYLSIQLPFLPGKSGPDYFPDVPLTFPPYLHQEHAFERLRGPKPRSSLIATGTGSGKTECFQQPILDHAYRHRHERGIKAILVYPMNALATDQAGRLAKAIWNNPKLQGKVTAGLFVGQSEAHPHQVMTETAIITAKDTLRLNPPDILLTNYKMLDYLLVRPKDFPIWGSNGPETLQYLVVDELHTFDGAQGTDLACLVRRLKARLKCPPGHLCCVGTSATLGGDSEIDRLLRYASEVFGETFDREAVVRECRQGAGEFLEDALISRIELPPPDRTDALDPGSYDRHADYVRAQHELWLGAPLSEEAFVGQDWRLELPEALKSHLFFQNLLKALGGRACSYADLLGRLEKVTPGMRGADDRYRHHLLDSLAALVSEARSTKDGPNGTKLVVPFLHVRVQLWLRELRRMVAEVSSKPVLRFADDLTDDQLESHLPIVHCRECGAVGWAGTKRQGEHKLRTDLQAFYVAFFGHSPNVAFLFPERDGERSEGIEALSATLCPKCLHLTLGEADTCPSCGESNPVFVLWPESRTKRNERFVGVHDCPYCHGKNSLTILGSRAASLTSVLVAQLFSSTFNDDKKLLTFSDSVQDAAHRAGFFTARTYKFNLRAALQQFILAEGDGLRLSELPDRFSKYWRDRFADDLTFVSTFLAPDTAWFAEYERVRKQGELQDDSPLLRDVERRLSWELHAEYGFNARIGRTLEKTSSSVAHLDTALLDRAVAALLEPLRNEIGPLRKLDEQVLRRFLLGLVTHLRTEGAILHPVLEEYVHGEGNTFVVNRIPWMPSMGPYTRAPMFLANRGGARLEPVISQSTSGRSWAQRWADDCFDQPGLALSNEAERVFDLVLKALTNLGVLQERSSAKGARIWGLSPDALRVSRSVRQLRCARCGHNASVATTEQSAWVDAPCLRFHCSGRYRLDEPRPDYYGKLYALGDVERVFSAEHSGLLARDDREELEAQFKAADGQRKPWYPNLLSCTPTLEMGVDIGDLSSLILCSVPPAQASYIQRVGRTGRRDGNSLNLTVANARPHDLFFFAEPEEMIAGHVDPPGVFLEASAVLERQLTAWCFDRWVEATSGQAPVPSSIGAVLKNLQPVNLTRFPHNLQRFVQDHRTELLEQFFRDFGIDPASPIGTHARTFMEGDDRAEGSLPYRIISGLHELNQQRKTLNDKVSLLAKRIAKKKSQAAKDQNYETELRELQREKGALQQLAASIVKRNTFNFFTDEGLLPNYAFPEAGVVLRSVIYRRKDNSGQGENPYDTWVYEYERAASSAIAELAPANHFYAGGRKVLIDQVDMSLSKIETWRLCPNCAHSELIGEREEQPTCPRCGDVNWADAGQKRQMLRMRQVFATTRDRDSRIGDDADDREPTFYNKQMLVDVDPMHIRRAFRLDCEDLPFGFEFLSRATFREINFGEKGEQGHALTVAGVNLPRQGFVICRHCGKVQEKPDKPVHAHTCTARSPESGKNFADCVYLYREFTSEAIRILLPIATFAESDRKLHSFVAALHLGLKKRFAGSIDHLQTAIQDEPELETGFRKRYLLLCDTVPGGTGYLKQLMLSGDQLMEVFAGALDVLTHCSCNKDPARDGCYRCLYAYRNSYDMKQTSRTTAVEIFSGVLKNKDKLVETQSLRGVSVNVLFDSALEAKFVEALRRSGTEDRPVILRREIVSGKPGYFFKIGERSYYIEPQVELRPNEGVAVPSRADFVIRPATTRAGALPIAIFTDGLVHHRDRIGTDTAQRMAIARSRRMLFWSLTWKDVESAFKDQGAYFRNYTDCATKGTTAFIQFANHYGADELLRANDENSFAWLIRYLAHPDPEKSLKSWMAYAFVHGVMFTDGQAFGTPATVSRWKKSLAESLGALSDDLSAPSPAVLGLFEKEGQAKSRIVRAFASAETSEVQGKVLEGMRIGLLLRDTKDVRDRQDFEAIWTGFLRLGNLFQFLPRFAFACHSGLDADAYGAVPPARLTLAPPPLELDPWADVRDNTDQSLHPLLAVLAGRKWPLPADPPFELVDDDGETIAEAELGWADVKIAVLDGNQARHTARFESRGWKVFALAELLAHPEPLLAARTGDAS